MKYIKLFEENTKPDVNILVDVSGSMQESQVINALKPIHVEKYNKIHLIQFTWEVENYDTVQNFKEILDKLRLGGGGTRIQAAVDFVIRFHLENNKTYILSDFYDHEQVNYSQLSNYRKIVIDENNTDVFPDEFDYDDRDEITNFNL